MRKISVSFLIVLLCFSLYMTFPCKADTVWSDDFNDGNYEGWTVLNGTFTVENGMLKSGPGDYNFIVHESFQVAFGTWSFDVAITSTGMDTILMLIGTYPISYGIYPIPQQGLYIRTIAMGGLGVLDRIQDSVETKIGPTAFGASSGTSGWQHIDVTRNSEGRICIYNNGTLVADVMDTSVTTTSEFLAFWSARQIIIDNVVVSSTVDIEPPAAAPFYTQTWFLASVGAIAVVAVAIVVLLLRRK